MAAGRRSASALFWGSCPDCGGELDVRSGEHGRFLGCSEFPRCEYSRSLDRAERNILDGDAYADRADPERGDQV